MKLLFSTLLIALCFQCTYAQEYFTITHYNVALTVNKDASIDVDETIQVHFTEDRHGIIRYIPYKYQLQTIPAGTEKAERPLTQGGQTRTLLENIKVKGWQYKVSNEGDYKVIKIGSADKYVSGDQTYVLHYRMLNAINFFNDHSELYFNIIGDRWSTTIDNVNFTVRLYKSLPDVPFYFIAMGATGSTENNSITKWSGNQTFSGRTTRQLASNEGLTIGIRLPKDFLQKPDYRFRGIYWLLLPLLLFALLYAAWKRWGKDEEVTIQTEYYPPQNISPSISGYIIDDRLNRRDLTALIPYWGAGGFLRVVEIENSSLFGIIKTTDYQFIKLKDLPQEAMTFEKTLFNGIFKSGNEVFLKDLKNVLYTSMASAKNELEKEINKNEYYVKGSKALGILFIVAGFLSGVYGFISLLNEYYVNKWHGIAFILSALLLIFFGFFMSKRTRKGTLLYQQLAGFKEFIKSVEQDRLKEFLKQDEHYFDKILPYAIVFNVADTWKDKLKGLEIPPPTWYSGHYTTFSTGNFMSSLNHSLNTMSATFYSAPSSSGSSGGSFGGGGFSGGGFGGGGGSSW